MVPGGAGRDAGVVAHIAHRHRLIEAQGQRRSEARRSSTRARVILGNRMRKLISGGSGRRVLLGGGKLGLLLDVSLPDRDLASLLGHLRLGSGHLSFLCIRSLRCDNYLLPW